MELYVADLDLYTVAILLFAGFVACFIDSTVGGGGLISTPSLLAMGLPVPLALGTNKLAASTGALASVISFWRADKINKKAALSFMPLSFIGSAAGAYVVYLLPETLMKNIIVVLLVAVAIYTYFRKDWGEVITKEKWDSKDIFFVGLMALVLGFYDGFFGPGTGSFLIFGFIFVGCDFVTAAGNAKALNFASGIGALLSFALSGSVIWSYGVILAIGMIIGAIIGSRMAIKKGAAYVRPLYLIVTTLLIGKQVYEILFK